MFVCGLSGYPHCVPSAYSQLHIFQYDGGVTDISNDWRKGLPTVSGTNVKVRELVSGDASALFELLTDALVTKHHFAVPPSVSAFEGCVAWAAARAALGKGVCFGIVPRGLEQAVGLIQVRALEPSFFVAEWGFALAAPF